MQIGLRFPYEDIGLDTEGIRRFVGEAEELGFSYVACIDHVLGTEHADRHPPLEGPYDENTIFREPFVLLSWIAAQTERLGLATNILVLPQRQTALVAKQASELQLLSNGRLRLGVGSGWNHVEYECLGVEYRRRGQRLDEQLEVLRRLWSEPLVDFRGRFHTIDRAALRPLPDEPVPIWFGGISRAQQERCAKAGDGFVFRKVSRAADAAMTWIREEADRLGRTTGTIGFDVSAVAMDDEMFDAIERWEAMGGTHLTLRSQASGDALAPELRVVARRLGTLLQH